MDGYIWKMEDTPHFIAGRIDKAAEEYIENLRPPFFKELEKYVEEYKYARHTPGHAGGLAFLKSPVGRQFYEFFGENVFRADLSVSVPELGSLMEHAGVNGEAEKNAAKVFNSDYTYFVTNGISTANKIVNHSCVSRGDVVLIDRNCHKSLQHAITMTGAIPIYLMPERNAYGIIGGIPISEFQQSSIKKKMQKSPLIQDKPSKIKLAVVTNSTYDGLAYDVTRIKEQLSPMVENLHLDEAWFAYAHFHPIYKDRYAMGQTHKKYHPTIFSTQSTHKLLAAFSQASMIHIKEGKKEIDPDIFNESFMMHTSTSPQYTIIASLDVASKMMEGKMGHSLILDSIEEAILFRQKMLQIEEEIKAKEKEGWWFAVWQSEELSRTLKKKKHSNFPSRIEESPLVQEKLWILDPEQKWHGYKNLEKNFMLLDPIKVTFLTPGVHLDGSMEDTGIPAPLVAKFLMSKGIVDEKTGFYSFLALFSIGITKGKSSVLLSALFDFKKAYDGNIPLAEALPNLVQEYPKRYEGMGVRDLAEEMHLHLKKEDICRLAMKVFERLPDQKMAPWQAYEELVKGNVQYVKVQEMEGRISAVMLVPYPPGIPIIMPGESIKGKSKPILDYLLVFEAFDNAFPGFETETHGIQKRKEKEKICYFVPCIQE